MIISDLLEQPYEEYKVRSLIWLQCDYCGTKFQKTKKDRLRLNKFNNKDSCGSKECSRRKREESNLIKWGEKNVFQSKSIKEKIKQTNLSRYGSEHYLQTQDGREKTTTTLIATYGVDSPMKSEAIKAQQKATCFERFGVTNYAQSEEFIEKYKTTSITNHGVPHPSQSSKVQDSIKNTIIERYGVEHYSQTEKYQEQRKLTCLERYGVEHTSQIKENRDQARATTQNRYGVDNYSQTQECKQRSKEIWFDKYGVPNPLCLPSSRSYGKTQQGIANWLSELGGNFTADYTLLEGKEIDLYDPVKKIAIEYCGLYWHNELSPTPRDRMYHYMKYIQCKNQDVHLITIFEDEWIGKPQQCKSILASLLGVYSTRHHARKCRVDEIPTSVAREFCDQNHLQGGSSRSIKTFGLIYNEQIVGILSLGHHPRKKNDQTIVLDRLCFQNGVQVIGGATKLFAAGKKWAVENQYKKIITWSDNRWSAGSIYPIMGFILEKELPPDYSYVDFLKPHHRISKQSQKKSLTGCPPEITEYDWSKMRGLARIWDCGKKRWVIQLQDDLD